MKTVISLRNKLLAAAALLTAAALTAAVIGIYGITPSNAADEASGVQPTKKVLSVSGQGKVSVTPDIAYVSLGVVTEDKDAKTAQKANAAAMDKVVGQIRAAGIKAEDIKTVSYSIYPKYDYNKDTGASHIIGFTVNNTVQVTVRDVSKTGPVIDAASDSGANVSNSISFGVSDNDRYYNEALKKAVESARSKAKTIADTLGVTVKTPVSVSENGSYYPIYDYNMNYSMKADAAGPATPVQAGTMEVQASVSMVYEY